MALKCVRLDRILQSLQKKIDRVCAIVSLHRACEDYLSGLLAIWQRHWAFKYYYP